LREGSRLWLTHARGADSSVGTEWTRPNVGPKAEAAARRWPVRYLSEGTPSIEDVAKVTASLAKSQEPSAAEDWARVEQRRFLEAEQGQLRDLSREVADGESSTRR
jgi:hypothetical protein